MLRQAAAASTAEPSVTIPSQDLSGQDILLPHFLFGGKDGGGGGGCGGGGPDSKLPSSVRRRRRPSRSQHLESLIRNGSGRALATSAFTSAELESFPAEDRPLVTGAAAAADAPARPQDHPAIEPALSRLLAPPFSNAALRGDFIVSLERHLAEYEDGGVGDDETSRGGEPDGTVGGHVGKAGGGGGGGRSGRRDGGGVVAARDVDESLGFGGDRGQGGSGRAGDSPLPDATATAEIPVAGARVAETEPSQREIKSSGTGEAAESVKAALVSAFAEDVLEAGSMAAKENNTVAFPAAPESSEEGTIGSSNWAQEYHDYLCSKE